MAGNDDCKVYVGNLPSDVRVRDLEDVFYKYGRVVDVDLHAGRRPPFAFVEFEDERDAEDAVRGRDGYTLDGYRIRVEFPRSSSRGSGGGFRSRGGGRGGGGGGYRQRHAGKGYQLIVSGLPPSGSWQDLKDHFRPAGDVVYTESYGDGTGVVELARYDDFKRALRDFDDSKFKSHEGEVTYIRVKDPKRNRSRSPSPYRRSRSRSRSWSRSRSRSRSKS